MRIWGLRACNQDISKSAMRFKLGKLVDDTKNIYLVIWALKICQQNKTKGISAIKGLKLCQLIGVDEEKTWCKLIVVFLSYDQVVAFRDNLRICCGT